MFKTLWVFARRNLLAAGLVVAAISGGLLAGLSWYASHCNTRQSPGQAQEWHLYACEALSLAKDGGAVWNQLPSTNLPRTGSGGVIIRDRRAGHLYLSLTMRSQEPKYCFPCGQGQLTPAVLIKPPLATQKRLAMLWTHDGHHGAAIAVYATNDGYHFFYTHNAGREWRQIISPVMQRRLYPRYMPRWPNGRQFN